MDDRYRLALHWMEEEVDAGTEGARNAALAVMGSNNGRGGAEIESMKSRIEEKTKPLSNGPSDPGILSALLSANLVA